MENVKLNENEIVKVMNPNRERRKSFAKIANNKLGETVLQNCGEVAFIVEYINSRNITVQFKNTGELVNTTYGNFSKGIVKSHFTPSVYGVGIVGLEKTKDSNGDVLQSYECWNKMLQRCYSNKFKEKYPTYKDCSVCDEWLFYPNFKEWYDNNYYEINGKTSQLDKDILHKGNKVYSPENCVFVPQRINKLFIKCNATRGELPIGVTYNKTANKYQAQLKTYKDGKTIMKYLGLYTTPEQAFEIYKQAKENYIKQVAEEYKDKIPVKLYEAMYNYTVDIND